MLGTLIEVYYLLVMTKNILLICGSLNQTTIMQQIASQLSEYNCYFTPYYATGFLGLLSKMGLLDFSILGGRHRRNTENYLAKENLPVDYGGRARNYDLVVTCQDLIMQDNIKGKRLVLVQEGITEPEGFRYQLVRTLKFPRFLANTAATGLSDAYDVFCVGSAGYRNLFIRKGAKSEKLVVTGIPNFDHARKFLNNNFPYHDYVLVATSSIRETFGFDDRFRFLQEVKRIAAGRQIIFKLHPNELHILAKAEINAAFPDAKIFTDGNTNHMIANCDILIAQRSSVVYIGLALGKAVYSEYDRAALKQLLPVQNEGKSAERIAEVCRQLIQLPDAELARLRQKRRLKRKWRSRFNKGNGWVFGLKRS